jgi:hypothetical protein
MILVYKRFYVILNSKKTVLAYENMYDIYEKVHPCQPVRPGTDRNPSHSHQNMEAVFRPDVAGFFSHPSDRILPGTTSIFRKNQIIFVTDTGTRKRMETCGSKKLPKHDFSSMKNEFFHHV